MARMINNLSVKLSAVIEEYQLFAQELEASPGWVVNKDRSIEYLQELVQRDGEMVQRLQARKGRMRVEGLKRSCFQLKREGECVEEEVISQTIENIVEITGKLYYVMSKIKGEQFHVDYLWTFNTFKLFFRTYDAPSYSSGPSTPTNYSLGSSRNGECSNCKHLRGKISVLKATMEMHMHPEQHTVNSAALFHEAHPIIHCSSASLKSSALFNSTLEQLKGDGSNIFFVFCNVVPLSLIPYYDDNLHAESVLTDIEYGYISTWIPLDDMKCKYINGTILCEVRDYRVFIDIPVINKVPLKMTLAGLVKDMSKMSEQFSYQESLEFESRVLKSMHPFLNLEPTPVQEFGIEIKPLIKLIDWDTVRRTDTSDDINPLKSFQNIDIVTRRNLCNQLLFSMRLDSILTLLKWPRGSGGTPHFLQHHSIFQICIEMDANRADATSSTGKPQTQKPTQTPVQTPVQTQNLNQTHVQTTALQNQNQPQAVASTTTPVVDATPTEDKPSEPNQVLGKVRTLTFERPINNVFQDCVDEVANKENQIQVVLKKNFGEEVVDMTTLYGHNVDIDIGLKFNQSFRKSQKAHLHAQQFIKLVEDDGYFMISDFVEDDAIPMSPTTSDVSSTPQFNVDDIDFLAPFDYKDPFAEVPPSDNLPGTSSAPKSDTQQQAAAEGASQFHFGTWPLSERIDNTGEEGQFGDAMDESHGEN
ncbi:retrovirus-related pol polyprotein from transposon TNT 1-94 [Tanacetum coccineum]